MTRAWWPLAWAVLHLTGMSIGGVLPDSLAARTGARPGAWGRLILMTPLLAWGRGPAGLALSAAATVGSAAVWSAAEASARRHRVDAIAPDPWGPSIPVTVRGSGVLRLSGWPAPADGGRWRAAAHLLAFASSDAESCAAPVTVGEGIYVTGRGMMPAMGGTVAAKLVLTRPRGASVDGAFDYRRHLAGRGLTWTARTGDAAATGRGAGPDLAGFIGVRLLAPLRLAVGDGLGRVLPPRESRLGASVLLGARDADSRQLSQPFADLGLAHLFAVSGLHVGIVLGLILWPARALGLGPAAALVAVLCLLPPYAALTGLPGSVVRAAGLGTLAVAAPVLGRRLDPLRALGLLYAASVGWEPVAALDTGLRLSYLAAGGILAVSRLTGGLKFSRRAPWSWLGAGLGVTLAAQWFTLPVAAQSFGRISLIAPLANLVAVPVFAAAVWLTVVSLVLGAVWLPAGQACGALAWLLLRTLAAATTFAATRAAAGDLGLPEPAIWQIITWAALGVVLLVGLRWRQRSAGGRRAFALLLISAPCGLALLALPPHLPWPGRGIVLRQFDVGQGDCGLLVFPDGWSILLDTGDGYSARGQLDGPLMRDVLPYLHRQGRSHVDAVVLTHGHRDHTGGARAAATRLQVDAWYCGGRAAEALAGLPDTARVVPDPAPRLLHRWRDWELTTLAAPRPPGMRIDENDLSLVVVLKHSGRGRLVWSGDLESRGEARLLAARPELGDTQVWKAGHHGSATSGSPEWLARLRPELVLVSCGVGNRYRHPSHGAYVVAGDTVDVRRSDLHGTVTIRWDPRAGLPKVRTVRTGPLPGTGAPP